MLTCRCGGVMGPGELWSCSGCIERAKIKLEEAFAEWLKLTNDRRASLKILPNGPVDTCFCGKPHPCPDDCMALGNHPV